MYRNEPQLRARQIGLSLIELMIALVVGLILMAGVISIFIASRQSYGINNAVGQIQENGRFALDFIRTDTRLAGYMGCANSTSTMSDLNTGPVSNLPYDFDTAITGFEYTGTTPGDNYTEATSPNPVASTANWSPVLDPTLQNLVIPGTDVLVVRYSKGGTYPIYINDIPSSPSADFKVTTNGGLAAGDLILVSNCLNAVVMQVTNVTGGGINIVHNTGGTYQPGNALQTLPTSFLNGQVVIPTTVVFYIGRGADLSPALFEAVTNAGSANGFTSNELVSGVENMQVLYGVDLTGSQIPSEYDTAATVDATGNWGNVVSVRIALLLRSETGAVPLPAAAPIYNLLGTNIKAPQDTRLRQIFTSTIAIRNRLP